jgi:ketosteroid isomerase-like protein
MSVIDAAWARSFAEAWVAAWNARDLERVLSHYADDFEMRSPLIVERVGEPTGTLRGKEALRSYWAPSLTLNPPLRFELIDIYAGVDMIVIHYRSVGRREVTEVLAFDVERRAVWGSACWRAG